MREHALLSSSTELGRKAMLQEILEGEFWNETDFDEPTPKSGTLMISDDDVQTLRDFEAFVGGDCFDVRTDNGLQKSEALMGHLSKLRSLIAGLGPMLFVSQEATMALYAFEDYAEHDCFDIWHSNGGRSKSLTLTRHLDGVREVLDKLLDYPEAEFHFYTTPPVESAIDELHPLLTAKIGQRSSVRIYYAGVYCAPDGIPIGGLEFLVDEVTNETCGLFRGSFENSACLIGTGWKTCGQDMGAIVEDFVKAIAELNTVREGDEDEGKEYASTSDGGFEELEDEESVFRAGGPMKGHKNRSGYN
ncbi:MAG: hypothetical protein KGI75_21390 [Rhizobiaceae bacterium]|nr:hypothetical protein [Rhizobiaceae bacterium]